MISKTDQTDHSDQTNQTNQTDQPTKKTLSELDDDLKNNFGEFMDNIKVLIEEIRQYENEFDKKNPDRLNELKQILKSKKLNSVSVPSNDVKKEFLNSSPNRPKNLQKING